MVSHLIVVLGWVDFDWVFHASTIFPHIRFCKIPISPGITRQTVEHSKFKSTQTRSTSTWDALYSY